MTPFKKSLILMACLSAYFTPPLYALTVSNNAAQVETQGPAAAPAQTPDQTQPMNPADATDPNHSPNGGEAPSLTSPALNGPPSAVTPLENNQEEKTAPKSSTGNHSPNMSGNASVPSGMQPTPQGMLPPGMQAPSRSMPPQGMQGVSQNMQAPTQGMMQAPPQGMQGAPQGMQAPPQGMQTHPQGVPSSQLQQ